MLFKNAVCSMAKHSGLALQSMRLLLQTLQRGLRRRRNGCGLAKTFGVETTVAGLDRFYIKRGSDGSCAFLCNHANNYFCALQNMKPEACKIWPFKVCSEPKYGEEKQAAYDYGGVRLYVYGDTMCSGIRLGTPTWDFRYTTVKEFT